VSPAEHKALMEGDSGAHVASNTVLDAQGRQRFHGAFTGGYSAGYYNTVGSKEGWKPSTFKSSRSGKSVNYRAQRPEDFMDEEDEALLGKSISVSSSYNSFGTSTVSFRLHPSFFHFT